MDTTALLIAILVMSVLISPITMMEDKRVARIDQVEQGYSIDKIALDIKDTDMTSIFKDTEYVLCEPTSPVVDNISMFDEYSQLLTDLDKEINLDKNLEYIIEFENISRDGSLNLVTNKERYVKNPSIVRVSNNSITSYSSIKTNILDRNNLEPVENGTTLGTKILKVDGLIPNYIFPTLRDKNTGKYYSIWITDTYYIVYEKQGGENLSPLVPSKNYKKII